MRALTSLCLTLALFGLPVAATAQPKESGAALENFKKAQERFDANDYSAALELSRAALEATGSPNARLYVARSLRELGRLAEAYAELERTLQDAREAAKKDPKYGATRDSAAAELALLDSRVGKVIVALVGAPPGASVELNGKPLDPSRYGRPIAVEPGDVVVEGKRQGASPVVKQVSVKTGETQRITLVFDETKGTETSPAPVPPPEPPHDEPTKKTGGGLRTAGYVVAGVGVVGLGVFAVTGSMARSKYNQLEDECGSKRCTDPKYADTVDSGKQLTTIANVGLAVGSVGLLAGGAMILFGGPSAEKTGTAFVSATPTDVSLRYFRRF
jgi:hypothetical protein